MRKIYLGCNRNGDRVELDFEKENINFILLAGYTGAGKSIFHNNLYKELLEKYSSSELGFVFLDNTMSDFDGWQSDYIVKSVIGWPKKAITALAEIANKESKKILFIHIEECDMVYIDRAAVENSLMKLRGMKNVYIVYSTSRMDKSYLGEWMEKFIDLKVIFSVTLNDSLFFLGNESAGSLRTGERVLAFNNQQIHCRS